MTETTRNRILVLFDIGPRQLNADASMNSIQVLFETYTRTVHVTYYMHAVRMI